LKRIFDIVFSLFIIICFLPFGLLIMIILFFSGEGEIFYNQSRVGKDSKNFGLIKFATMIKDSPNIGAKDITLKNDSRVLPFGKFLRKTKLNEFPQFINILIGDMSLVGPRPLVRNQYEMIPQHLRNKIKYLKPGVTGIGSIIFRDEEKYFSSLENSQNFYKEEIVPFKAKLECWYNDNNSIRMDFILIFITSLIIIFPNLNFQSLFIKNLPSHPIFNPKR
jgi:lipopolysaccharide/colanic/teichoic acid biosynthesis glycosyltransferase